MSMQFKPVIFVVISALLVAAIYSSSTFYVFAAPKSPGFDSPGATCINSPENLSATCCWDETELGITFIVCQTCDIDLETGNYVNCGDVTAPELSKPPRQPLPSDPDSLLDDSKVPQKDSGVTKKR